ncbi:amidohydrolase family protein [Acuticoccus mangrovi]|uniref:Amidohydrolase family protein n=1 Tax=Acuticoccus mangrovi TaxID=2796142 RepID=A0A934IQ76_9HYPH|nr:amidohydrolase family protein [Acuticoccus mangrovi]MBJ3776603.1 amidohydrolase family protein [Acuticoccus mangrovi]
MDPSSAASASSPTLVHGKPLCAPPLTSSKRPRATIPTGGWDSHCHLFGALDRYLPAATATHMAPEATLADYRALLDRLGLAKGVFVTSTVYGTDNRLLLEALQEANGSDIAAGWLRGIAVIDASISDAALRQMHEVGVRGFRINLMQKTGGAHFSGGVGYENLMPLAERVKEMGWHAQLWVDSALLGELRADLAALPVPFVIDHFGRTQAARGADDPGFSLLCDMLAAGEAYAKISGAYRISNAAPDYPDVTPMAAKIIAAAPTRLVWGTDWPHPNHAGIMPDDADLLDVLAGWCEGDDATLKAILVDTPTSLYA